MLIRARRRAAHGLSPAVVLGVGINGLGVVRSLAAEGVPVLGLETDVAKPTCRTRYAHIYKIPGLGEDGLLEGLKMVSDDLGEPAVLFLTEEDSVRTVALHRDELRRSYRFTLPSNQLLETLMHKGRFNAHAQSLGMPLPRTLHLDGEEALGHARELSFPCILKPSAKDNGYAAHFKKAYLVESVDQVVALYQEIGPVMRDMVLQEWVDGDDSEIYFCLQYTDGNGRTVASFTGRKLRSWPPATGGTASCTVADEKGGIVEQLTSEFFRASGFAGMGSMEFKWDRRRRDFVAIEPTVGRSDYQEEVATLHGVNIPYAAYLSELDRPVPSMSVSKRAVVWKDGATARWAAALQAGSGASHRTLGRRYDAYWRFWDPGPGLYKLGERVARKLRR